MPAAAGILIGLAGFFVKSVMAKISLNPTFILQIMQNPLAYLSGILGIVGFIIFQKSLYKGKVSTVTPIMNGLAILIPVVLAVAFLGEAISTIKIAGIALIVAGVAGLRG